MEPLDGKVAVVTGGASGIGLAMAKAFGEKGMKLVLADVEADALDRAVAELGKTNDVVGSICDVSDPDAVDALRDEAIDRFGGVHLVANNAGVSAGGLTWDMSLDDWEWVLDVNLRGVIHGVRSFVPHFVAQGEGHVVNTASMAGVSSPPFMSAYNVSKHGVVALSETLFSDLEISGNSGVGVSVLCPGWVRTRIHEAYRNRPVERGGSDAVAEGGQAADVANFIGGLINSGLDPDDVAAMVVDAVVNNRFYILTHPEWFSMITDRTDRMVAGESPRVTLLETGPA